MKNYFFLLLLICLTACKFESQEQQHTPKAIDASKEIFNWTCQPGTQIGLIHKNASEAEIIKIYGQENVTRREIGLGEGETTMATIVFPQTKNELEIVWKRGKAFQAIDKIIVEQPEAPWATTQGIGVGTSLEELVKINGKDFQFAGFEWDYSGYTNDWQGGKIPKSLAVYLEPSNPELVYPDLLGDELFSSSLPKAKAAELKVRTLVFLFD